MLACKGQRVVVAMSGGVDSSVAALLLKRQGFDIIGLSMKLWRYSPEVTHGCCTPEDMQDARRVAQQLDIPHYVLNMEKGFAGHVIGQFVDAYAKGQTPNPCIRCNTDLKFDILLARARELGAEHLATGHYARVMSDRGRYQLWKAKDVDRDQSYFLFGLTQAQLATTLFPLGELTKSDIRAIARQAGLVVGDKPDSQEICFVSHDYRTFVNDRLSMSDRICGQIVTTGGEVVSQHQGIHHFTVGQRKGLGIASRQPWHVVAIHPTGTVVIGSYQDLLASCFEVTDLSWVDRAPDPGSPLQIKIRSRFNQKNGSIIKYIDSKAQVLFECPQPAITPGQAAVFYHHNQVLGGGWIARVDHPWRDKELPQALLQQASHGQTS